MSDVTTELGDTADQVSGEAPQTRGLSPFKTNDLGDVYARVDGTDEIEVDPTAWGWLKHGGANDLASKARPVAALNEVPGLRVSSTEPCRSFVPGPKPARPVWNEWRDGAAPPAAVESVGGTRAYFDRVSEATAYIATILTPRVHDDTMYLYDFYVGERHTVDFRPRVIEPGKGIVYLVADTDGETAVESAGLKVGYTSRTVASRIVGLQVGNPRTIHVVAEILGVTEEEEYALHADLAKWHESGEWFSYPRALARFEALGGIEAWVRSVLTGVEPAVDVRPEYEGLGRW